MTRRLLLTAILAVILTGTAAQIIIGIVIALAYCELFFRAKPYRFEAPNNLLLEGQFQILLTFIGVLVVKQNSIPEIPYHEDVLDLVLLICNTAMLLSVASSAWKNYQQHYHSPNESTNIKIKSIRMMTKLRAFELETIHNRELVEKALIACSDESIGKLLSIVYNHIVKRRLTSAMKYTFYMPLNRGDVKSNKRNVRFLDNVADFQVSTVLHHEIESKTIYLRIPSDSIDLFRFVCRFDCGLVVIPSEVFMLPFQSHASEKGNNSYNPADNAVVVNNDDDDDDYDDDLSAPFQIPIPESVLREWDEMLSLDGDDVDLVSASVISSPSTNSSDDFLEEQNGRNNAKFDSMYSILSISQENEETFV
jgi:hypothetical protein